MGRPIALAMCGPSDLPSAVLYEITDIKKIKTNKILYSFDKFLYLKKFNFMVNNPARIKTMRVFVALVECCSDEKGSGCIIP